MGRKVVIVDCCAGPGKFDDGEMGSPLIIGNILSEYYKKGADVVGYFIEQIPFLFERLEGNLSSIEMPYDLRNYKQFLYRILRLSLWPNGVFPWMVYH